MSQCPTKDSSSSLRPTSSASQNAVRRPRHLAQHLGIVHLFRRHLRIKDCNDQWAQNALTAPSRRGVLFGGVVLTGTVVRDLLDAWPAKAPHQHARAAVRSGNV